MDDERRIQSRKKLKSTRRFIGNLMKESLRTIPQASPMFEIETDAFLALKDELKMENPSVTITSMLVRLMATILRDYPLLNSAVVGEDLEELVIYDSCNVGVGIGLEQGIMTVVIKEAQDKDVFAISEELKEKTALLKEGQLPMADMKGSTFTVSSIGVQGLKFSTVIINPPESAMLCVGTTERRVVARPGDVVGFASVTTFGLTHNHVVLDGVHVGRVVELMKERLAEPGKYMGL